MIPGKPEVTPRGIINSPSSHACRQPAKHFEPIRTGSVALPTRRPSAARQPNNDPLRTFLLVLCLGWIGPSSLRAQNGTPAPTSTLHSDTPADTPAADRQPFSLFDSLPALSAPYPAGRQGGSLFDGFEFPYDLSQKDNPLGGDADSPPVQDSTSRTAHRRQSGGHKH